MVSNHFGPVRITADDRRYLIVETSDQKCKQFEYFKRLFESFDGEFYNALFSFFMNRDISAFNPRDIPETEEKKELIEFNKSSYEMFFEEREEEFERGWICTDCYRVYAEWARQMGFAVCAANTFGAKMRGLVQHKKKKIEGRAVWIYSK